jgi:hypothetical protein
VPTFYAFHEQLESIFGRLQRQELVSDREFLQLKRICADPDFDFTLPGLNGQGPPLFAILDMSCQTPHLYPESVVYPAFRGGELLDLVFSSIFSPDGGVRDELEMDDLFDAGIEARAISAARSGSYLVHCTERAIDLLEVAKAKGVNFALPIDLGERSNVWIPSKGAPEGESPLRYTYNLVIADWLVDNGALWGPLVDWKPPSPEMSKLAVRLNMSWCDHFEQPNNLELTPTGYERLKLETRRFFRLALERREELYSDGDPVMLLIQNANQMPSPFVIELLGVAESLGYNFRDSQDTCADGLLSAAVSGQPAPLEVIAYLLERGADPFKAKRRSVAVPRFEDLSVCLDLGCCSVQLSDVIDEPVRRGESAKKIVRDELRYYESKGELDALDHWFVRSYREIWALFESYKDSRKG